jgi:hypothetical protein
MSIALGWNLVVSWQLFLCRYCIIIEFVALPIKNCKSNGCTIFCFQYSFVAIKITSKLRYYILLGILCLNLPIQWLLILGCTLNVSITFTNLNAFVQYIAFTM